MTDARGRLEAAIRDVLVNVSVGTSLVQQIADAVERALAPEPPAPLKVWPGLEGDGLRKLRSLFTDAYDAEVRAGKRDDAACRAACTAQAAHLWRAMVASLPEAPCWRPGHLVIDGCWVARTALASLADPYGGGGTGVGK